LKIVKAEHWTEPLALFRPYRIAGRTITDIENHFVRLQADTGACGYGAASPGDEVTGETLPDCADALDAHLEACLLGKDLNGFLALIRDCRQALCSGPAALAAVEMAILDLVGKGFNLPVADLFGRRHHSLPTSVTIGIQDVSQSLHEAQEFISQGFRILKIKIGDVPEQDIELLHRLRETVGPNIGLRVDGNQGYAREDLLAFERKTRDLHLELIEQPLPVGQLEPMRTLPDALRSRCAGDETICTPEDALWCTHPPRPFGIYNIKLMKCGGIIPALKMAGIARMAGIELMWGCNDESRVSIAAALHAAMAASATRYLDLDGSFDLGRDLFQEGFCIQNGELQLTGRPGLGVLPVD
jgi:L-alanine-DL-glutamate epimerase-like enolase superfamily enzyme